MTDGAKGLVAMAAAATIWGLSGLYYKALDQVPPLEVLSHRILWSAIFYGVLLLFARRAGEVVRLLASRRLLGHVTIAAVMIAANWFLFIYSIHAGHALEASLGYYCFPLVAVALGYLAFGERFSRWQAIAIGLAAFAVLILTLGLGKPPWVALVLAGTFGCYGLVKKQLSVDPMVSVFAETAIFTPFVVVFLGWIHSGGRPDGLTWAWFGRDLGTTLMLVGAGPLTATPLFLMSYAAQRVSYATIGLVQYLNPTLQFTVAVVVFGEPFTRWHAIAFPVIWTALAIYAAASLNQQRSARSRSSSAGTSGIAVK
jgi:chloramphenicol-sensitive protein RarD